MFVVIPGSCLFFPVSFLISTLSCPWFEKDPICCLRSLSVLLVLCIPWCFVRIKCTSLVEQDESRSFKNRYLYPLVLLLLLFYQVSCFSEDLYLDDRAVSKIPNWLVCHAPSIHVYAMDSNGFGSWLCRDFRFFDCNHVRLVLAQFPMEFFPIETSLLHFCSS